MPTFSSLAAIPIILEIRRGLKPRLHQQTLPIMQMTVREFGDMAYLSLEGSLDLDGSNQIEKAFMAEIARAQSAILDFSQVTFIASFGMRLVIEAVKMLAPRGGTVIVLNPSPSVEKLLLAAGLDNVLTISHDEAEARAAAIQE